MERNASFTPSAGRKKNENRGNEAKTEGHARGGSEKGREGGWRAGEGWVRGGEVGERWGRGGGWRAEKGRVFGGGEV